MRHTVAVDLGSIDPERIPSGYGMLASSDSAFMLATSNTGQLAAAINFRNDPDFMPTDVDVDSATELIGGARELDTATAASLYLGTLSLPKVATVFKTLCGDAASGFVAAVYGDGTQASPYDYTPSSLSVLPSGRGETPSHCLLASAAVTQRAEAETHSTINGITYAITPTDSGLLSVNASASYSLPRPVDEIRADDPATLTALDWEYMAACDVAALTGEHEPDRVEFPPTVWPEHNYTARASGVMECAQFLIIAATASR